MPEAYSQPLWKPHHNPWLVALTVTLATFMEVLDTSIANVALPHIAGSLGASSEEATWVLTSYLVASAVILPISGWLSDRIGRKRFYMSCVVMFTACSLLCGLAPTLPALILARILQGLGGWITDNFNWHWIFFINLPVGLLSLYLSNRMVEDPPYLVARRKEKNPVDFLGLGLVACGVGCLEFTLDKGQEKDWFGDPMIRTFALLAVVLLIFFAWWEWRHPDPIVDLKLLQNRNFGTAVFLQLVLGMVLFGSTVLIPQFLQGLLGYTAQQAGEALSPAGFAMMVMMFLSGRALGKADPRLIVFCGYVAVAAGIYNLTRLDLTASFGHIVLWRVLQVIGLPFIFIPISTLNYIGVPQRKMNQVSSLSNFARNIGGSAGTALLTTFLARRQQVHQNILAANATPGAAGYHNYLSAMTEALRRAGMSGAQAAQTAVGRAYQEMLRQAAMLSYKDAFGILSVVVLCLSPLVFVMRLPTKREGGPPPEEMMGH